MKQLQKTKLPSTLDLAAETDLIETDESDALIGIALDASGSMMYRKDETVAGFNHFLNSLRRELKYKNVKVTLAQFNSYAGTKFSRSNADLATIKPLEYRDYNPTGQTPLRDATMDMIAHLYPTYKASFVPPMTIVAVQTDGHENASRVSEDRMVQRIRELRASGWIFILIGCNVQVKLTAAAYGMDPDFAIEYGSGATAALFDVLAKKTAQAVISGDPATLKLDEQEQRLLLEHGGSNN